MIRSVCCLSIDLSLEIRDICMHIYIYTYCIISYFIILYHIVLYYITLHYITLHYITLYYIILYYTLSIASSNEAVGKKRGQCWMLCSGFWKFTQRGARRCFNDRKLTRYEEIYLPDHYKRQVRGIEAALGRGAKKK